MHITTVNINEVLVRTEVVEFFPPAPQDGKNDAGAMYRGIQEFCLRNNVGIEFVPERNNAPGGIPVRIIGKAKDVRKCYLLEWLGYNDLVSIPDEEFDFIKEQLAFVVDGVLPTPEKSND